MKNSYESQSTSNQQKSADEKDDKIEKILSLEKACAEFRKKYNLTKRNVVSLKGKEKIKRNDIYKIALYLFEDISCEDMLNKIIESCI